MADVFTATRQHLADAYTYGTKLANESNDKGLTGEFMWDEIDHSEQDVLFTITNEKLDASDGESQLILETVEDSYYNYFDNDDRQPIEWPLAA